MANRWEKMETVTDFIFLGSKMTADGDCSHEIKRPWNKSGDKSRQCIKNRDITLPTKVCLDKATVFPVVMYDVRVGPRRRLSTKELMLSNYDAGEDS